MKNRLSIYLIYVYTFLVCFGDFQRFGAERGGVGISAILLIILVLMHSGKVITRILSEPILKVILFMIAFSILGIPFYPGEVTAPLIYSAILLFYLAAAAAVCSISFNETHVGAVVFWAVIGILVSCIITLIDHFGVYNFPGVNERQIATIYIYTEIKQATGFFPNRSALAAFLSLLLPIFFVTAFYQNRVFQPLYFFTVIVGATTLLMTHNRSGLIAITLSCIYFLLKYLARRVHQRTVLIIAIPFVAVLLFNLVLYYFPEQLAVYSRHLYITGGLDSGISESDYSRIYFFLESLKSILTAPFGHGFSKMYTQKYGLVSQHNVVTYIIWSTGVLSFIWITLIALKLKQLFHVTPPFNGWDKHLIALKIGFGSWLLNNMAHNSINMGMVWIILGLSIYVWHRSVSESKESTS